MNEEYEVLWDQNVCDFCFWTKLSTAQLDDFETWLMDQSPQPSSTVVNTYEPEEIGDSVFVERVFSLYAEPLSRPVLSPSVSTSGSSSGEENEEWEEEEEEEVEEEEDMADEEY